jgi:hypothetical protein
VVLSYVGADTFNPFTAESVVTDTLPSSSTEEKSVVFTESVARDSKGRIRFEKPTIGRPADDSKAVAVQSQEGRAQRGSLVTVFDCMTGSSINNVPRNAHCDGEKKIVVPTNPDGQNGDFLPYL